MEINSEVEEAELVEQEFFIPERAIFSAIGERDERDTRMEFF